MQGQTLQVVGSTPELGNWRVDRGLQMVQRSDGMWEAEVSLPTHRKIRAKVSFVMYMCL